MPKVTFVKSARKANPRYGIEVGDSYYHWAFMVGGRGGPKICSKTRPTRAQLTNSDFLKGLYGIFDDEIGGVEKALNDPNGGVDFDCVADDLEAVAQSLRDLGQEQRDKFDNMPRVCNRATRVRCSNSAPMAVKLLPTRWTPPSPISARSWKNWTPSRKNTTPLSKRGPPTTTLWRSMRPAKTRTPKNPPSPTWTGRKTGTSTKNVVKLSANARRR